MSRSKHAKPGRPSHGLTQVLYVRTGKVMIQELDRIMFKMRFTNPGRTVSRADVARQFIHEGIERWKKEEG